MGFYLRLNLEVRLNDIVRTMTDRQKFDHVYHNLPSLKLQYIYKLELAKFMYQLSFNKLPKIIESAFPKISTTIILHIPILPNFFYLVSKNAAKNQLSSKGIKLRQSIPDRIKTISWFSFEKTYKQILLSQFQENLWT